MKTVTVEGAEAELRRPNTQTKESVPNEGRGPGRQVLGAGGPRAPAMAGRRPPIDPCTRSARPAPPTHSPRRRATQRDPERLARTGMPTLPTSGWASVFGFIGLRESLPRCCRCHLSCCRPQHSIFLWNPIYNCRCIRACRQACQGICPRAVRPGFDPQAYEYQQAPLADRRSSTRCDNSGAPPPCSLHHRPC